MELQKRIIEKRLMKNTFVFKNQFHFIPGSSNMEATYIFIEKMDGKNTESKRDLHSIDLEKVYDRVLKEKGDKAVSFRRTIQQVDIWA